MKKSFLMTLALIISSTTFAGQVVTSFDKENNCDLYRVLSRDDNGNQEKPKADEQLFSTRETYGFSFRDMEIDFDKREVSIQPIMNIVLGINRPLTETKVVIAEDNKNITYLINQLNRSVLLFEKVCISKDGHVVYATMPEDQSSSVTIKSQK